MRKVPWYFALNNAANAVFRAAIATASELEANADADTKILVRIRAPGLLKSWNQSAANNTSQGLAIAREYIYHHGTNQ